MEHKNIVQSDWYRHSNKSAQRPRIVERTRNFENAVQRRQHAIKLQHGIHRFHGADRNYRKLYDVDNIFGIHYERKHQQYSSHNNPPETKLPPLQHLMHLIARHPHTVIYCQPKDYGEKED
jgi:hypothetical protein